MERSLAKNHEDIKIVSFSERKTGEITVDDVVISIPLGTSDFAIAAMLKGFHEYFLKPAGSEKDMPQEVVEGFETNLKMFSQMMVKKPIILQ